MGGSRSILLRMFGRPTGFLGWLGGHILARTNRRAAAIVADLLEVRPDDCVLEIGFGPGVGIAILAERALRGSVAGVDPSPEMMRQASARNAAAVRDGRVELRRGAAEQLPFADETFDKIAAINSMHLWADVDAGAREMRRVLKAGGRVVLGFTPHAGQSNDIVRAALTSAGLADLRVIEGSEVVSFVATKR